MVGKPSVLLRVLATFLPGPIDFTTGEHFRLDKTKGFDIFNYLNYFVTEILTFLVMDFFSREMQCLANSLNEIQRFCASVAV